MEHEQNIEDKIDALREEIKEGDMLVEAPTAPRRLLPDWRWGRIGVAALLLTAVIIVGALRLTQARPVPTAGETTIVGRVTRLDGSPLPARVAIYGTTLWVMADADGYFRLDHVPAGPQTIVVSYQNYEAGFPVSLEPGTERNVGNLPFWPLGE